jgi:nitrite reductase (NO-forming)
MKLRKYRQLWIGGIGTIVLSLNPLLACDACNMTFANEIMNQRSGSLVALDMQRAMQSQRGLPLNELKANYLLQLEKEEQRQSSDQGSAATKGAVASVAPIEPSTPRSTPLMAAHSQTAVRLPHKQQPFPDYFANDDFIEIIQRDYSLDIPPTSYVPQDTPADRKVEIRLHEGKTYIGNGVVYDGFLTNGQMPGPTVIVDEGDVVEFTVINDGTIPHGASIHAAGTQTSKYLGKIDPGKTHKVVFRATQPGVYMYHCAPGGHAIPMHVLFGQYGMMVVRPKQAQYELERQLGKKPDVELYLIQHEVYASGKDAVEGKPAYVMFNGRTFRYVEEPILAKPGDYVRIYFLNIGPNLLSTFHIVGIIWDYVYWQGHPQARLPGGQTVTAGPSDSWVIEFRVPPDEGAYTLLSHAVGSTSRGAIGLLVADRNAEVTPVHMAEGKAYTEEEMAELLPKAQRIISPFGIGTHPEDKPVVYGPDVKEVHVSIIGNSYYPKVIQVEPGTKVTWTNEDVFTYMAGEFSGIHNVFSMTSPPDLPEDDDGLVSGLLAHGETFSYTFNQEWEYEYHCTPHPYMTGRVIVKQSDTADLLSRLGPDLGNATSPLMNGWLLGLIGICFILSTAALARSAINRKQ